MKWRVRWYDDQAGEWVDTIYSGDSASDVVEMFEANRPDAFKYVFSIMKAREGQ